MLTDVSRGWLAAFTLAACLASPAIARAQAPPPAQQEPTAPSGDASVRGLDRLSPEDRAQAERNLQKWRAMTPEQRQRTLENYRQWQSLSPEEQQQIRERLQRYQTMTPEQRERFERNVERWRQMTPAERQHARDQIRQHAPEGENPGQYRHENRSSGPGGGSGRGWPYGHDRRPGGSYGDEGRPGPGPGPRGGGRAPHWPH